MLPVFLFSLHIYADSDIIQCIDAADSSCITSYEYIQKVPDYLERELVDSALLLIEKAIEVVKEKPLPNWKAYLYTLMVNFLYNQYYNFDMTKFDKDYLRMMVNYTDSISRKTPLFLYGRCARNRFLVRLDNFPRAEYQTDFDEIKKQPDILFHKPMPVDFLGYTTLNTRNLKDMLPLICWIEERNEDFAQHMRKLMNDTHPAVRLRAASKLMLYYLQRGMLLTGKHYYEILDSLVSEVKDPILRIHIHTLLGDMFPYLSSGSDIPLYHYRRALQIADSMGVENAFIYGPILNNYGTALEGEESLKYLRKALEFHIRHHGYYTEGVANVMANISNTFRSLNQLDSSIIYNIRTIDVKRKVRGKVDLVVMLDYVGLAQRYMKIGDTARAIEIVRAVLDSLSEATEYLHESPKFFLHFKAKAYAIIGKTDSAVVIMETIRDSMQMYPPFLLELAKYQIMNGNLDEATANLDSAFTIIRSNRIPITPGFKKEYLQTIAYQWENLIPLLIETRIENRIPLYSEILKSRLLFEEVQFSSDPIVDSMLRELHRMNDNGSPMDSIIAFESKLMRVISQRFSKLTPKMPPAIPEGTALLGYVVGRKHLLAYLISSSDTVIAWKDIDRGRLRELVKKLISNPSLKHTVSRRLWELLIEPFDTLLTKFDRVAISPHGILTELPFPILFDGQEYLVQKPYTTYRVFSLWGFDAPCTIEGPALALGRNDYGENPVLHRRGIGNLKYAEEEASSVVRSMGGLALIGNEVSEDRIYRINLDEFSIIHFATHAIVDSQSMIVLGPQRDTIPFMDNILRLGEIYSRLRVGKLVVLSGCRTGLGKFINDWEGLFNLTRGFVYAGAKCVITTMWDTNDFASYHLMSEMYRNIAKGYPIDLALKKAQTHLLQETGLNSPVYWGAFTLTVFGR